MQNMSSSSMEDIEEQTSESVPANETDKAKLTRLLIINESDECTEYDICDSRSLNDEPGMYGLYNFLNPCFGYTYTPHI